MEKARSTNSARVAEARLVIDIFYRFVAGCCLREARVDFFTESRPPSPPPRDPLSLSLPTAGCGMRNIFFCAWVFCSQSMIVVSVVVACNQGTCTYHINSIFSIINSRGGLGGHHQYGVEMYWMACQAGGRKSGLMRRHTHVQCIWPLRTRRKR